MTNSKQIPNVPINWHRASNLPPGLIRAEMGPEWLPGGNGKCSGLTEREARSGRKDKVFTCKMLWTPSFPTRKTDVSPL